MIAVTLTSTAIVWIMNQPLTHAGGLAIAIATLAMLWNMLFNAAFDRAQAKMGFRRTIPVRVLHALLFEIGLMLAVVPLAAWWLDISLLRAFILDIGVLVFFLFYALVYNWCYDVIRARLVVKQVATIPRQHRRAPVIARWPHHTAVDAADASAYQPLMQQHE